MIKKEMDEVIKEWGERLFYPMIKGKKGKNVRSGGNTSSVPAPKPIGPATREKIARTARKAPEVVVKISGGGKNMRHIEAHMEYISRNGEVEIEDENGDIHKGKEAVRDVRDSWAKGKIGIPSEGEKRKEAFNIILSMPPGTDRKSVKEAAREFAKENFDNHQYVFASHEDEKHPHVHLAVKAVSHDGIRLNPRKADLQQWREQFAEKMREQGIEANATPRRARGIVKKPERHAVWHINKDYEEGKRKEPARVTQSQIQEAESEIKFSKPHPNPAKEKIIDARKDMQKAYGQIARALVSGDGEEKKIALDIVNLVRSMPPTTTKHDALVQTLKNSQSVDLNDSLDADKAKETKSTEKVEQKGREQSGEEHSR